jgi:LacI family transcriptional regulator
MPILIAGRLAARHLLDLGHRRVALLFPPSRENDRARLRQSGAIDTFLEAGITIPPEYIAGSQYDVGRAKSAARGVLRLSRRPTAILCGNDVIARGAIYAALELGLAIPDDISVVGIGDFPGSAEMVPALTTVRIPAIEIGAEAARQLVEMILSNGVGGAGREFPVELVVRGTTGPAR